MIALALLALLAPASTPLSARGLCLRDETPLFVCPIKGKIVSVCGSGTTATYRYGRPGKIEMSVRGLTRSQNGFSGGGETQISFDRNSYAYIVYDRTTRTGFGASGNDPKDTSGLIVRKGPRTVLSGRCAGEAAISGKIDRFMPEGPYRVH